MSVNSHFTARGGSTDLAAYSLSIHQPELTGSSLIKPTGREHSKDLFQKTNVIREGRHASAPYSTEQEFTSLTAIPSANYEHVLPPIFPPRHSSSFAAPSTSVVQPVQADETRFAADHFAFSPPYNIFPSASCDTLGSSSGLSSSYTQLNSSPLFPISLSSRTDLSSCEATPPQAAIHSLNTSKKSNCPHDFSHTHHKSNYKAYGPSVTVRHSADGGGHAFSNTASGSDQLVGRKPIGSERSSISFNTSDTSSRGYSASNQTCAAPHVTQSPDKKHKCEYCAQAFARRHDRDRHERMHTGEKPYICSQCKKGFMRSDALSRHQLVEPRCGRQRI